MDRLPTLTDEQWLSITKTCPPTSRLVGMLGSRAAIRHEDGTGVLVDADGSVCQVAATGQPLTP
jgi:hypothetical protein